MFKTATATLLAAGLVVAGAAIPASATHPTVTGTPNCDTTTGQASIAWTVTGDLGKGYDKINATIESLEVNGVTPADVSAIGLPLRGNEVTQTWAQNVEPGEYRLSVGVQFENHKPGKLAYTKSATVVVPACVIPDVLDATASAVTTPATCAAAGSTAFAIENATWENDTDTTDGERNAIANSGHKFADSSTTLAVAYPVIVPATDCVIVPPALCEAEGTTGNVNGDDVWWEIHFGRDAATQNMPALFNAESFGGWIESAQQGYDDKPAKHMIAGNIYVHMPTNAGQSETWHFVDGTTVVFTVGTDTCNPTMTWETIPPVVVEPEPTPPPVEPTPTPVVDLPTPTLPAALAFTGSDNTAAAGLGIGSLLLGLALVVTSLVRHRKISA